MHKVPTLSEGEDFKGDDDQWDAVRACQFHALADLRSGFLFGVTSRREWTLRRVMMETSTGADVP